MFLLFLMGITTYLDIRICNVYLIKYYIIKFLIYLLYCMFGKHGLKGGARAKVFENNTIRRTFCSKGDKNGDPLLDGVLH